MLGKTHKMGLEALVFVQIDSDMGMPTPVRDRIAKGPYWRLAGILDGALLLLEELVLAVSRHEQKHPTEPDVLHVGKARLLSPCP